MWNGPHDIHLFDALQSLKTITHAQEDPLHTKAIWKFTLFYEHFSTITISKVIIMFGPRLTHQIFIATGDINLKVNFNYNFTHFIIK